MSMRKRYGVGIALFGLALVVLTLILAPQQNDLGAGSTYSRAPSGYGAWYAYMSDRVLPIRRWEKPTDAFFNLSSVGGEHPALPSAPMTLLQIQSTLTPSASPIVYDQDWLRRGNALVHIGMRTPVSDAPFQSAIVSPAGEVLIETRRRHPLSFPLTYQGQADANPTALLEDTYGAIVWEEIVGNGRVIFVVTPYLAANAYQNEPGNFEFLATLLESIGYPIYVDEYLHGYKDDDTIADEVRGNLGVYLWQTPLSILVIQAVGILALLIWGLNRRLGPAAAIHPPVQDSNRAYINALASVLRKANSSDFAVETLQKAEVLHVQRSLGLGDTPLDPATIMDAWHAQTSRAPDDIQTLLTSPSTMQKSMTEVELRNWLQAIADIRQHLPNPGSPALPEAKSQAESQPVFSS